MPRPYSQDLRARAIEAVEAGAPRREAAERYEISASAAVLWTQRWKETGSFAAEPSGGSVSLLEQHAEWLLALIGKFPASCGLCSHVNGICSKLPPRG
jgi:putative transposase